MFKYLKQYSVIHLLQQHIQYIICKLSLLMLPIIDVGIGINFPNVKYYYCLEKLGSPLEVVSPPLGEAVEVHAGHVEHHFKVCV